MSAHKRKALPRCSVTGKKSYRTVEDAERTRARMSEGIVLHTYRCPECGRWHIGHAWGYTRQKSVDISAQR